MFPPVLNVATLNGINGFTVYNIICPTVFYASDGAGDVNGDGIDDLVIGSPGSANKAGQVFIAFGSDKGFNSSFNTYALDGKNGFTVNGIGSPSWVSLGNSVSGIGDFNNDGISDFAIGQSYPQSGYVGQIYVIFGDKDGFNPFFNLASLNGKNGFIINAISSGGNNYKVGRAGDVNGDKIPDLIIGAAFTNGGYGQSYIIYGKNKTGFDPQFNLADLNGVNGFTVSGIISNGWMGFSVNGIGDFNGNGVDEIAIGSPESSNQAGQVYVIFGNKSGFDSQFDLNNLNGANGFIVNGEPGKGMLGYSVNGAGDFNNDGFADIIIGAPNTNGFTGKSYVIFGTNKTLPTNIYVEDLDGSNGFTINGINANSYLGFSVSGAGNVNGDDFDDIIVADPQENGYIGMSLVIFGTNLTLPANIYPDYLNGTTGFIIDNNGTFVRSVSAAGDVNHDGVDDFILESDRCAYVIFGNNETSHTPYPTPSASISASASASASSTSSSYPNTSATSTPSASSSMKASSTSSASISANSTSSSYPNISTTSTPSSYISNSSTFSHSASQPPHPAPNPAPSDNNHADAIAGGVIGIVLAVSLCGVGWWAYYRGWLTDEDKEQPLLGVDSPSVNNP